MKPVTFDKALALFKKLAAQSPTRSYAQTFHVTGNGKLSYTDGFALIILSCPHSFAEGVYKLDGQPSSVVYPNTKTIIASAITQEPIKDVSPLLQVASLVKPVSRQLVIVSDDARLDGDSGINLKYLSLLPTLGVIRVAKYGDLYHGVDESGNADVYVVECRKNV